MKLWSGEICVGFLSTITVDAQLLQHHVDVIHMFLWGLRENQNVIEVSNRKIFNISQRTLLTVNWKIAGAIVCPNSRYS